MEWFGTVDMKFTIPTPKKQPLDNCLTATLIHVCFPILNMICKMFDQVMKWQREKKKEGCSSFLFKGTVEVTVIIIATSPFSPQNNKMSYFIPLHSITYSASSEIRIYQNDQWLLISVPQWYDLFHSNPYCCAEDRGKIF